MDEPDEKGQPPPTSPTTSIPGGAGTTGSIDADQRPHRGARGFAPPDLVAKRYRVLRFIAEGGMGEVYEVEDTALGGRLALKTIRTDIGAGEKASSRFRREIQLARRVTHPSVCRIFDLGFHRPSDAENAVPFLTMELLDGETLSRRLATVGRMTPAECLPLLEQMAAGLDAAHALGIIHRDFKPGNVMLVPGLKGGERAVITDFGLARTHTGDDGMASISDAGNVAGTPAYMAPEQVQGQELTPAADVYAFGVVLYEMLTGTRPFGGDSAISVAVKRVTTAPTPPTHHVPGLDPLWEAVIMRCLERHPNARFKSPSEAVLALRTRMLPPKLAMLVDDDASGTGSLPNLAAPPLDVATTTGASARRWPLRTTRERGLAIALLATALGSAYVAWRTAGPGISPGSGESAAEVRRSIAVLPVEDQTGRRDLAWVSTALAEMLGGEVAATGRIRLIPAPLVLEVLGDRHIATSATPAPEALATVAQGLGADLLVAASVTGVPDGAATLLRLHARVQEARTGRVLAEAGGLATEAEWFQTVSRVGRSLREKLGADDAAGALEARRPASLPSQPAAARLYAEGLSLLRRGEALAARTVLENAVSKEPSHPLPHAALAEALSVLGYERRSADEARKASNLAAQLPTEDRLSLAARADELSKQWRKAIAGYRQLCELHPDDVESALHLAEAMVQAGRGTEALVVIQALRLLPPPTSQDPRIDLAEARAFQESDPRRMLALSRRGGQKAAGSGSAGLVLRGQMLEATALEHLGEFEEMMRVADAGRALAEARGNEGARAQFIVNMAMSAAGKGDLSGALRLLGRAKTVYRQLGHQSALARISSLEADVFLQQGRLVDAETQFIRAVAAFQQLDDRLSAGVVLNSLGAALQNRGRLDEALERYRQAIDLFQQVKERRGLAVALTNTAEILYLRGQLADSRQLHEEALVLASEAGDKTDQAYCLYRLGIVLAAMGQVGEARQRFQHAARLQDAARNTTDAAQTRIALAKLALFEGNAVDAEALARRAEEVLRASGAEDLATLALAVWTRALLALGRVEEATTASADLAKAVLATHDVGVRHEGGVARALARAASGSPNALTSAEKSLATLASEARRAGLVPYELDARLAWIEIGLAGGRTVTREMEALRRDAGARGFVRISRQVSALAGQRPHGVTSS